MANDIADDASTREPDEDLRRPTEELSNDELMIRFKDWWRQDMPRAKAFHKEAVEDFKFRAGDQWKEEDQQVMEDLQKRACLVFNQIDPVVDAVCGSEIINRQEVRFIPRQLGAAPVNEVLTNAAKWFRDECDAEDEESLAFADAVTTGMGWTETRLDYEVNADGDPRVERVDPMEMIWDGNAKQSALVDARRVMRVRRLVPLVEAQQKWPKDAEGDVIVDDGDYDATWAASDIDRPGEEVPYEVHFPGDPLKHESSGEREEQTVTIVQIQWYERVEFYRSLKLDPESGQTDIAELTPDEHMTALDRSEKLGHIYRGVKQHKRVYYKAYVGARVLEVTKMVGPSGAPATSFSLLCLTGKFDRNKSIFYGLVRSMRGPQTFANKWLSTAVEMLARGSKGGLMLEEGAVADAEDFEDTWSTPGANAYFRPGAITGGKVQPKPEVQFPENFMGMTQFAISSIRDVTGVNVEQLGLSAGTPNPSQTMGQEYMRKQSASIILAPLFNSLRRYRKTNGRFLLWLITEFLSDGRLIRITGAEGLDQYVPLIHSKDTLRYDVIVDDAPTSPNQKEEVWRTVVAMLPLLQGLLQTGQLPAGVIMTLMEYGPLPASVFAKMKAAVAQFQQEQQQNKPPDPTQLIMMEKNADVQAEQEKLQMRLQMKQQENNVEIAHRKALARLDIQSKIAEGRVKAWAKTHEAATQAAAQPAAPHPMDSAVQEGLAQGVQKGVAQVAATIAAQQFGAQENVTGEPGGNGAAKPSPAPADGGNTDMLDIIRHLSGAPPKGKPEKPQSDPAILDLTKNVHGLVQHLSKRKTPVGFKRTPDGMRVIYDGEG